MIDCERVRIVGDIQTKIDCVRDDCVAYDCGAFQGWGPCVKREKKTLGGIGW